MTRRSLAVSRRVFQEMRHDKRTVGLMLFAPIFAMFVFGLAFSGEVHDVTVVVVNSDKGVETPMGQLYVSELVLDHIDGKVLILESGSTMKDAVARVEDGTAYAVLFFPENFTRDLQAKLANASAPGGDTTMLLRVDESNVNVAASVIAEVNLAVKRAMEDMGQEMPLSVDSSDAIYGNNAEFMDFFVPGIMAFVVYILTTLLTLLTFVGERTSGTLERIQATPLRPYEIVLGYAITFSIVGVVQAAILLAIGILVFDVMIVGNVIVAFLAVALLAVVCQALGIMLSSFAKREAQAVQFFPFIVMPAFLLSGIFWPLEAIPKWLRPFSYCIPVTYAIDACRSVMLRGWGLEKIWLDLLLLLVFAAVFMFLAFLSLRRVKA